MDQPQPPTPLRLGAIVLAGGGAARMGGVNKANIEIGGVTLLERALAATMQAIEVVVLGEQVETTRPVTWTLEDPHDGGPAAGLYAGLDCFLRQPDIVAVLAVDMPKVEGGTIARLTWAVERGAPDGAMLVDANGRTQPLCAVYRVDSLLRVRPDDVHGLPMKVLMEKLVMIEVEAIGSEAHDVDTFEDLQELRRGARVARNGPEYDA